MTDIANTRNSLLLEDGILNNNRTNVFTRTSTLPRLIKITELAAGRNHFPFLQRLFHSTNIAERTISY